VPLPVTVYFQDLRSAVDASNYDGDGRNGSPGMMAFLSGESGGQIGEETPARRRPELALPNPGTGSLGARGMPGREGAPAWTAAATSCTISAPVFRRSCQRPELSARMSEFVHGLWPAPICMVRSCMIAAVR
jgi:hypothetical protein